MFGDFSNGAAGNLDWTEDRKDYGTGNLDEELSRDFVSLKCFHFQDIADADSIALIALVPLILCVFLTLMLLPDSAR